MVRLRFKYALAIICPRFHLLCKTIYRCDSFHDCDKLYESKMELELLWNSSKHVVPTCFI